MTVPTRDQELWAMALHVEKHHGDGGAAFIAEQEIRFSANAEALDLWASVRERYTAMRQLHQTEALN